MELVTISFKCFLWGWYQGTVSIVVNIFLHAEVQFLETMPSQDLAELSGSLYVI